MICEAKFWGTGTPCTHEAKYLAPYMSLAVCGIHRRGLLRCIPIEEIEPARAPGKEAT